MDYRLKIGAAYGAGADHDSLEAVLASIREAVSACSRDGEVVRFAIEVYQSARWEMTVGNLGEDGVTVTYYDTEQEARAAGVSALSGGAAQVQVLSPDQVRKAREWNRALRIDA